MKWVRFIIIGSLVISLGACNKQKKAESGQSQQTPSLEQPSANPSSTPEEKAVDPAVAPPQPEESNLQPEESNLQPAENPTIIEEKPADQPAPTTENKPEDQPAPKDENPATNP